VLVHSTKIATIAQAVDEQKETLLPVPGIEPGSFRCFRSREVKAEYPSLWTIPDLMKSVVIR
jgi:hypothetical protein